MPSVLTIGNFDGVHLGHQAIIRRARQIAATRGAKVVVLTFDPHPAGTLRPGSEPPRLSSVHQKVDRLKAVGADEVVVVEPSRAVLGQKPEQFIGRLVEEYQPLAVVEGADFRFGKGRAGDMTLMTELGRRWGFETVLEPPVQVGLSDLLMMVVSSSFVRWLIGRGRVVDAAICLGEPFALTGTVTTGEQRGRTIGVPTANLDPAACRDHLVPMDGVYAGEVELAAGRSYAAAISVGLKPTFGQRQLTIEAHLLDFSDDIYGQTMTIRFARWLRDQYHFSGVDRLREQLGRDLALTRRWHSQGLLEMPTTPYLGLAAG